MAYVNEHFRVVLKLNETGVEEALKNQELVRLKGLRNGVELYFSQKYVDSLNSRSFAFLSIVSAPEVLKLSFLRNLVTDS